MEVESLRNVAVFLRFLKLLKKQTMNEVKNKERGNNTIDKDIQRTSEIRFKTRI
jgi:hypothetical protein